MTSFPRCRPAGEHGSARANGLQSAVCSLGACYYWTNKNTHVQESCMDPLDQRLGIVAHAFMPIALLRLYFEFELTNQDRSHNKTIESRSFRKACAERAMTRVTKFKQEKNRSVRCNSLNPLVTSTWCIFLIYSETLAQNLSLNKVGCCWLLELNGLFIVW